MPFDITAFPQRPSQSVSINLGHSLAGGLQYAATFGVPRGWGVSTVPTVPTQFTARNLRNGRYGQLVGTVLPACFSQGSPSGSIGSNNGAAGTIDVVYDNASGATLNSQCSIFCVVRDFAFNGDRGVVMFKAGLAVGDVGIALHTTGPNAWGCSVSNGAVQQRTDSAAGTRIQGAWQTLCASYNSAGEFFNFYVSGSQSPDPSPLGTIGGVLGVPAQGRVFQSPIFSDGQVAVAYFWNRALSRVQMMQLHADPFLLFRVKQGNQAFGLGSMTRPMA